jgi:hypothetical protein
MELSFQKALLSDLIVSLKAMTCEDLVGLKGEQVLMKAYPLYEALTLHSPKRNFKTFCALSRAAIRFKKSFRPEKFQMENLGIH